jgi:preprotein translocase subunit SecY
LFGATSLGLLAMVPIAAERMLGTSQLSVSGTGLLIVVSVALETLRQIQSQALMQSYDLPEKGDKDGSKGKKKLKLPLKLKRA